MTVKDWTEEVLALLRLIISWPVLVAVFLFAFRRQIATVLIGIRRVSREGIDFGTQEQQTTAAGGSAARDPVEAGVRETVEQLTRGLESPILVQQEKNIIQDLQNRNLTGEHAIKVLVRYLAAFQRAYAFERLYGLIWGSQLLILNFLNAQVAPVPLQQVRPFYDQAAQQYPTVFAAYPFENYLNFLTSMQVVMVTNNTVAITALGRDFLTFIAQAGKPIVKPQ